MAGIKAVHTRVVIDGVDLSTHSTGANTTITAETEETTTFQADGAQFMTLDPEMVLDLNGYYVDANTGLESELYDALTNTANVGFHYGTSESPSVMYIGGTVNTENLTVTAPVPGVIAVSGAWLPTPPQRSIVIGWGTYTSTGAQSAVNYGSGQSTTIYHFVTGTGGGTNVSVSVEESADGATGWTNVSTEVFSAVGTITTAATVTDPYLRVVVNDLGGGTGPSITVAVLRV